MSCWTLCWTRFSIGSASHKINELRDPGTKWWTNVNQWIQGDKKRVFQRSLFVIFFAPLLQGKERRRGVGVGDAPEYLGGVILRGQGRPRVPWFFKNGVSLGSRARPWARQCILQIILEIRICWTPEVLFSGFNQPSFDRVVINDELVKSHIPYVVHASTSSARTEYQ